MELCPKVHKIERVNGAASFLVMADGGACVIDTGLPGNERKVADYLKSVGVEPTELSYIVLTHADIDHSGSAAKLKDLTGAQVAIHEADVAKLSGEEKLKDVKGAMGALFRIMGPVMRFTPVVPDIKLKDADKVLDLVVVHTPGHTEGSISLLREKLAIFVGDALRTDSAGRPRLPPPSLSVNMDQAKESIRKISALQYDILLPGHGQPITSDASKTVADFVKNDFA